MEWNLTHNSRIQSLIRAFQARWQKRGWFGVWGRSELLRGTHCKDRPGEVSSSNLTESKVKGGEDPTCIISMLGTSQRIPHSHIQCFEIPADDYNCGVMSSTQGSRAFWGQIIFKIKSKWVYQKRALWQDYSSSQHINVIFLCVFPSTSALSI